VLGSAQANPKPWAGNIDATRLLMNVGRRGQQTKVGV
jgi:hypothetical protein